MAKRFLLILPKSLLVSRIFQRFPTYRFFVSGSSFRNPLNDESGKKLYSQDSEKNVVKSPLGDIQIPEVLFHDYIFENTSVWERRVAIVCGHTGKKYTFLKLRNYSKTLAAWLQNKMNFSKGDVILTMLHNCPEFPVIFLASSRIGVILAPINPAHTPYEVQKFVSVVEPKAMISSATSLESCLSVRKGMKSTIPIFFVRSNGEQLPEGTIDITEALEADDSTTLKPVDIRPHDTLVLPFSSGTTGFPKGVLLSHRNVVANLAQLSHPETTVLISSVWYRRNTILQVLPMFHIFGMVVVTFFTLREGARLVVLPRFKPREFIENLYRKKVSILYAVPPIFSFLTHKAIRPRYLKHLRYLINGSSSYSLNDVNKILGKFEHIKIAQGYGMTESSPVLTHSFSKRMQKLTSVGIPVASTKLKVVNIETGENLPSKKKGELYAFGPQIMKEYFKNPKETQAVFDKNGWLKTGDVAYYDEDGDFFIVERLKEIIKVLGYQVSPSEIEETLKLHPQIKDATVIGVPHERYGQVPKAFVILEKDSQLTQEDVQNFIAEKHARYKHLRGGVVFVKEIPRSAAGKVLRKELK